MFKKVVVTGSLAFDHIMSMPGRFGDHILPDKLHILNVSFIMETFRQEFGGTGGNIVYSLGLLGTPCILVAAAGRDFSNYRRHLLKVEGIDVSGVSIFKDEVTARGFVTTDKDDNQIWGFYEGAMKLSKSVPVSPYLASDTLLMIAPNDPVAMIRYAREAKNKGAAYVFDPAFNIPHFSGSGLKAAIKNSEILIGNDYEIELIQSRLKCTKKDLIKWTKVVITTLGAKGSKIETSSSSLLIPPARPENESDPTGAGDAYRAGFLAGYFRGLPLGVCGRMGAISAVYTVEKYGTQTHYFNKTDFLKRYKLNFGKNLDL